MSGVNDTPSHAKKQGTKLPVAQKQLPGKQHSTTNVSGSTTAATSSGGSKGQQNEDCSPETNEQYPQSDSSPVEKKKKTKEQSYLYLCTTKCRYVVVKKALRHLGYKMMDDEVGDWDIYWNDTAGTTPEQLSKLQPHQRINHYPGMYQLARKNNLCKNLMRMHKAFPADLDPPVRDE
jgi:hypothetical protein